MYHHTSIVLLTSYDLDYDSAQAMIDNWQQVLQAAQTAITAQVGLDQPTVRTIKALSTLPADCSDRVSHYTYTSSTNPTSMPQHPLLRQSANSLIRRSATLPPRPPKLVIEFYTDSKLRYTTSV